MNSTTQVLTTTTVPGWIEFVSSISPDIFMRSYCGHWARGVMHNKKRGWLVFEHGSDDSYNEADVREVTKLWTAGKPLPKNWHRFDAALANKAWLEGVRKFGEDWYDGDDGDGPRYDWVLQMALFNDVVGGKRSPRYG